MDLRYLHFLLSAYSWLVLVLCGIMLFWIFINNLSEIAIGPIKFKTVFALRSFAVLAITLTGFCCLADHINKKISIEMQVQKDAMPTPENDVTKKTLAEFYETITHDSNTAIFAFLLKERPEDEIVSSIQMSVVQIDIKYVLYVLPAFFLFLELILLGYVDFRDIDTEAVVSIVFGIVLAVIWVVTVHRGIAEITDTFTDFARMTG